MLWAISAGGLAGLATLALDELLACWTLGYPVLLPLYQAAVYIGAGALVGVGLECGRLVRRLEPWRRASIFALSGEPQRGHRSLGWSELRATEPADPLEVDEATRKRLQALGYLN